MGVISASDGRLAGAEQDINKTVSRQRQIHTLKVWPALGTERATRRHGNIFSTNKGLKFTGNLCLKRILDSKGDSWSLFIQVSGSDGVRVHPLPRLKADPNLPLGFRALSWR